jgi:flagellum-specific ATP synthase
MNTLSLPDLTKYEQAIAAADTFRLAGRVVQVVGLTIEALGVEAQIGEVCEIPTRDSSLVCEVVGFREKRALLMPLGDLAGIQPGSPIFPTRTAFSVPVGMELLGRVLDGLGNPIDSKGPLEASETRSTTNTAPHPLDRKTIKESLVTGVRAIDGFLTCGKGQRMGIFAGSGVGKSTLMGAIARSTDSDVSVIALVGERGREVQEFIERDLGEEGLERSVLVVSTSDQPALLRLKAASVATTIAEYYRDQGLDVTLLMDSVTRYAMAQREVGLAIGEPPASKGYPPSVFSLLPRLLERAGAGKHGTITGFFTVLVEGDDFNEPICDTSRSILDGHIVLSRDLAARNHYPAIDVLNSVSRVMPAVTSEQHRQDAAIARKHLAVYEKARDLVNIGAYAAGSDPEVDAALDSLPALNSFLLQGPDFIPFENTLDLLHQIGKGVKTDGA